MPTSRYEQHSTEIISKPKNHDLRKMQRRFSLYDFCELFFSQVVVASLVAISYVSRTSSQIPAMNTAYLGLNILRAFSRDSFLHSFSIKMKSSFFYVRFISQIL